MFEGFLLHSARSDSCFFISNENKTRVLNVLL